MSAKKGIGEAGIEGIAHLNSLLPRRAAFLIEHESAAGVGIRDFGVDDILANAAKCLESEFHKAIGRLYQNCRICARVRIS